MHAQKSPIRQQQEKVLFASGQDGYACYRIPAIVALSKTHIIALAEGRKQNCADFGDVDILMRHSVDGGQTWAHAQVVVDNGLLQAGNATPVMDLLDPDYPKGRLFLFYNTGTASEHETRQGFGRRRGYYITSTDGGLSWSEPTDISSSVHWDRYSAYPDKDARTFAFAPGHAIQFETGPKAGRIYVPANHSMGPPQEGFKDYRSYGVYSDDHGGTWSVAEDLDLPSSNEVMAVALQEEELLLLVRMQNEQYKRKALARSLDGGASWSEITLSKTLTTPMCQSSILKTRWSERPGKRKSAITLWHLGPADTLARNNLCLWSSDDRGQNWQLIGSIWPNSAAYSDMVELSEGKLGILYERSAYQEIAFSVISVL